MSLTARLHSSEEKAKEMEKEQEDLLVLLDEVANGNETRRKCVRLVWTCRRTRLMTTKMKMKMRRSDVDCSRSAYYQTLFISFMDKHSQPYRLRLGVDSVQDTIIHTIKYDKSY